MDTTKKMPALFISHGSPMNLIQDNEYTRDLKKLGETLPRPKAILMFSGHWSARDFYVSKDENPEMIYDFYGFPKELYNITYEAKGAPEFAEKALELVDAKSIDKRGLDHGTWAVLHHLFPKKDIPIFQISLSLRSDFLGHYKIGEQLKNLRDEGVMFIGSGNTTHNLMTMQGSVDAPVEKRTLEFSNKFKEYLFNDPMKLIDPFDNLPHYRNAHPSEDHYLPFLPILGSKVKDEKIKIFHDSIQHATLDMTSFIIE